MDRCPLSWWTLSAQAIIRLVDSLKDKMDTVHEASPLLPSCQVDKVDRDNHRTLPSCLIDQWTRWTFSLKAGGHGDIFNKVRITFGKNSINSNQN